MIRLFALVLLTALWGPSSVALAQKVDALSGFSTDERAPIQIEADRLQIIDKDRKVEFSGKVKVVQGEMTMTAERLIVFYAQSMMDRKKEPKKPEPAEGEKKKEEPQITRIEAEGGIKVRQRDQVATGRKAVYEASSQIIRLSGNVVLTQGKNVVRGDVLLVNLATRESKIQSARSKSGRVMFIGTPGQKKPGKKKD